LTYHDDFARTGAQLVERTLSPANVTPANFGKLFSYPTQGIVYAQPVPIEAQVPGNGQGSTGDGFVHFNGRRELNRSGLALSGGVVYLSFTSPPRPSRAELFREKWNWPDKSAPPANDPGEPPGRR
jgi:hypothetical protein